MYFETWVVCDVRVYILRHRYICIQRCANEDEKREREIR